MSGSAGGVVRAENPAVVEAPSAASPHVRNRVVEVLAREPFIVLVLAVYAVVLTARPWSRLHSDTWLALVSGRLIWHDGLPHHDTLTVWASGRSWVDEQWLGQLLFYGIHAVGGLRLLLLVHAAILVLAFGLALVFARRTGGSSRSVALVGIVGLLVALPNTVARTQSFAYVLFVTVFWLLASNVRRPTRRVLLVLPLLILWANIHGSVVLGAGLVVLWALAQIAGVGLRLDREAWLARARPAVLAAVTPLCLLVSPYGLDLIDYYRDVLGAGAFRELVSEWAPATFSNQLPFYVLGLGALWLAARKPRSLTLFEHLVLVCTLIAGFQAIRNIVWFALVAVMVVPRALDEVWRVGAAPVRERINVALSVAAVVVAVGTFAVAASHSAPEFARGFSSDAPAAISAVTAADPRARVFANEEYADWLLWESPSLAGRVAYDARFELLTNRELHSIEHFRNQSSEHWQRAAAGYRILVLNAQTELRTINALLREPDTRWIYRDGYLVVLLRGTRR